MALFKCKMCGGDLEIAEGVTIAECEYCGTKQTVPTARDENMQALFNRANTLRIKSEFDKAEKLYEKIIQADPTQTEAYWGLILCKYGIEYVDDPATFKKVPTCHRASFESIVADDDYKSALKYADMSQRAIYEEQAKEIDRIQKDILALAQKEETYDVFICYKETDSNGQRTQDSVIANDIYYQLTNEGFKVFYAAITLEGKLGSAYEPIIFAALTSSKVMLAIGTKPEHFNAVWVKNEWYRYLKIAKKDRSKLLIPCYRDMDAYELPEEFAHLQAQDMAKIGFINDLVRGIKKVIKKDEPKQTVVKETVVKETVSAGAANTAPLLRRAFMSLEDGEFDKADDFCEQVLNQDPENAQAYLGKLMAELRVKKQDSLKDCAEPFDNNNNYKKVLRFANQPLKNELAGYIEHINVRNENVRLEAIYINAIDEMESAVTKDAYYAIAEVFESISHYKDSALMAEKCIKEADEVNTKNAYLDATNSIALYQKFGEISHLEIAIEILRKLGDYKDSPSLLSKYEIVLEEENKQAKILAKRNKKIALITISVICAICIFLVVLFTAIIPSVKYNYYISNGVYGEAVRMKNLTEFTIPDGVTSIGDSAFYGCSNITSITIPDSVTSIGDNAFAFCSSLNNITIPNSVTEIGSCAFERCTSLTNITIPDSVTSIGDIYGAFAYCSSLNNITIPDSVTSIGDEAFYGCSSLTSITIPDSVTSIGDKAFSDCSSLTSITIPDSVTSIGVKAFSGCSRLTSITIPNSITSIGQMAFYECRSLQSITFKGTTSEWNAIDKGTFWNYKVPATEVICSNGTVALS